jgi:hypothetical protein
MNVNTRNKVTKGIESVPTLSDLIEHTTEAQTNQEGKEEPMEEDDDGMATIMLNGIPKTIPTITPNHQWGKDLQNNLPKQRYGMEIKINPPETPTEESRMPDYHHPRIFKEITTALMTASPSTTNHNMQY